jgi:hypothetical protein
MPGTGPQGHAVKEGLYGAARSGDLDRRIWSATTISTRNHV